MQLTLGNQTTLNILKAQDNRQHFKKGLDLHFYKTHVVNSFFHKRDLQVLLEEGPAEGGRGEKKAIFSLCLSLNHHCVQTYFSNSSLVM